MVLGLYFEAAENFSLKGGVLDICAVLTDCLSFLKAVVTLKHIVNDLFPDL